MPALHKDELTAGTVIESTATLQASHKTARHRQISCEHKANAELGNREMDAFCMLDVDSGEPIKHLNPSLAPATAYSRYHAISPALPVPISSNWPKSP
jgi:predicted ATPase with chaperone activity